MVYNKNANKYTGGVMVAKKRLREKTSSLIFMNKLQK